MNTPKTVDELPLKVCIDCGMKYRSFALWGGTDDGRCGICGLKHEIDKLPPKDAR